MHRRPDLPSSAAAAGLSLAALSLASAPPPLPRRSPHRAAGQRSHRHLHDYEGRLADRHEQIARSNATPEERQQQLAEAPKEVSRDFLDENLLLSRADQLEISPSAEMMAGAEAQARKNWASRTTRSSATALRQTGMTAEDFRTRVRETLMYQEVLDRDVMSQIKVSDGRSAHATASISRTSGPHADSSARSRGARCERQAGAELEQLARDLRAQLQSGKTLEDIAASGKEAGTTSSAIDLGSVEPKDIDQALAARSKDSLPAASPSR
jgi:peptidyl-prolyl cis-trans isomerase SurA